jgi:hypothetical protein
MPTSHDAGARLTALVVAISLAYSRADGPLVPEQTSYRVFRAKLATPDRVASKGRNGQAPLPAGASWGPARWLHRSIRVPTDNCNRRFTRPSVSSAFSTGYALK